MPVRNGKALPKKGYKISLLENVWNNSMKKKILMTFSYFKM